MNDSQSNSNSKATLNPLAPRPWMKTVLIFAAIYNIAWGAFAIFFPMAIFEWCEFDPLPLYPQLWQCIGMIVGVYGIGYWIAARHPFVHWPVILVGLLGKIFGPIGFVSAVLQETLPARMGWTILTNDLIWWIPFATILFSAARYHQSRGTAHEVSGRNGDADQLFANFKSQNGRTLAELSNGRSAVVLFLRHAGCTFCRQAIDDFAKVRKQFEAGGHSLAIVHMGDNDDASLFMKYKMDDVDRFSDPQCELYRHFELALGTASQLFGPVVWARGFKAAIIDGYGFGGLVGNGFQMPGVFVLQDSKIIHGIRLESAAERPDFGSLNCKLKPNDFADQKPVGVAR